MIQYLEMLERMKDLQVVKFFSQFFTESSLSPMFNDLKARAATGSFGSLARELIVWAILLAVGAFLIDQAFYWTRPGQIEQARETWQGVRDGAVSLYENAHSLILRIRTGAGKHKSKELPRGHR